MHQCSFFLSCAPQLGPVHSFDKTGVKHMMMTGLQPRSIQHTRLGAHTASVIAARRNVYEGVPSQNEGDKQPISGCPIAQPPIVIETCTPSHTASQCEQVPHSEPGHHTLYAAASTRTAKRDQNHKIPHSSPTLLTPAQRHPCAHRKCAPSWTRHV